MALLLLQLSCLQVFQTVLSVNILFRCSSLLLSPSMILTIIRMIFLHLALVLLAGVDCQPKRRVRPNMKTICSPQLLLVISLISGDLGETVGVPSSLPVGQWMLQGEDSWWWQVFLFHYLLFSYNKNCSSLSWECQSYSKTVKGWSAEAV